MNIYEEKEALPFDVYQKFLEKVKKTDPGIYSYFGELGFLIENEDDYKEAVSKSDRPKYFSRGSWEEIADNLRFNHLAAIDVFCSELKFMSDPIVKNGVILFGGLGNGDIEKYIEKNTDAEIIGIDYSKNMLGAYKKLFKQNDCILGDCKELPMKDQSVDQLLLSGVGSMANSHLLLKEASRVLVPEGRVKIEMIVSRIVPFPILCKDYDESLRIFMDEYYENPKVQNLMRVGLSEESFNSVFLNKIGLECWEEYFNSPLLARKLKIRTNNKKISEALTEVYKTVYIPYAINGKKVKGV